MSNFVRLTIVGLAALLIGTYTYANAFDLHGTALGDVLYHTAFDWVVVIVLVLAVALVNRWWALSVAFVPAAILIFLHEATDYVYPYHEDSYPLAVPLATAFWLAIASLGFPLRALCGWGRRTLSAG